MKKKKNCFLSRPRAMMTVLACVPGITALAQAPANDDASAAISLPVGATCSGSIYTNENATQSPGEPYASCNNESTGQHGVWFSFAAPASGFVKITTDNGAVGTLSDTKIGLFEAGNAADYGTFNLIACDEDNGADNGTTDLLSTIFATGLTPGNTYYVQVDGKTAAATGSFCLQVQEVNPTMLSNTASCTPVQNPVGNNAGYTGWVTLVDASGQLVSTVRNLSGGAASAYSGAYNINGGGFVPPRLSASGIPYLNRNFFISNTAVSTPVEVQLFFHPGELVTYNGGNAATLNVTRQTGAVCSADFTEANGVTALLTQTANGSANGVGYIQVTTPGFSNFYLMDGSLPLPVELAAFGASREGAVNLLRWKTAKEEAGDYFEIERGTDAKQFAFLARVGARGSATDYEYADKASMPGTVYYRLKLNDRDGGSRYSGVVKVSMATDLAAVKVFPNPAGALLQVQAEYPGQDARITITDIAGKTLYHTRLQDQETTLDISSLSKGLYLLKYSNGLQTETIKLVKK